MDFVYPGDITLTDNSGTTWSVTNAGVANFGASVTIAGTGDGTDALILTLGDILVTNGHLDVSGGDANFTLDAADTLNVAKGATTSVDVMSIAGGGVTDAAGLDALSITLTASDGTDRTNALINGALVSQGTGANDIGIGLFIDFSSVANAASTNKAIVINGTAAWDADIQLQKAETISNVTDDMLVFSGTAGTNNTSITFDLDSASATNVPSIVSGGSDLITINDSLSIGIDGETTENISDGGFAIAGGNGLYVEDMLGVNGNAFFDGTSMFTGAIDSNGEVSIADTTIL